MILTSRIQILSIKLTITLILISLTHVQAMETINQTNLTESPVQLLNEAKIIINISEQKLYLYKMNDELVKDYPISSSKYGIGSKANTGKTPLGLHKIENKIGADSPTGTIFKGRKNTGKIANIDAENGDLVTTRIMWLKGLEAGKNLGKGIDSYKRYIYIHGTAEESKIGQPASHGCIRMLNHDVIDLFDRVQENTSVNIVMNQETVSNLEKPLDK